MLVTNLCDSGTDASALNETRRKFDDAPGFAESGLFTGDAPKLSKPLVTAMAKRH